MKTGLRRWKFSDGEKAYFHRTERHVGISLKSLFVPLALSCVVLVGGKYLSGAINIDPHSTLFRLWPFNEVYLRQLANSPYSAADIRWFFTVVSCSNVIWLVYLVWKLAFELLRTDVAFPPGKSPGIFQMIIRFSAVYGVMLILGVLGGGGRVRYRTRLSFCPVVQAVDCRFCSQDNHASDVFPLLRSGIRH